MALFSMTQLIGKTLYLKSPQKFYRVADIVSKGDNAKPVSNSLKRGYFFVVDSYLAPGEQNNQYGFTTAKRSDYYFTWRGNDGNMYAIKYANNIFDLGKLTEQGALTVKQEVENKEDQKSTFMDNLFKNLNIGKDLKPIIYIGLGVVAVGYLLKSSKK